MTDTELLKLRSIANQTLINNLVLILKAQKVSRIDEFVIFADPTSGLTADLTSEEIEIVDSEMNEAFEKALNAGGSLFIEKGPGKMEAIYSCRSQTMKSLT